MSIVQFGAIAFNFICDYIVSVSRRGSSPSVPTEVLEGIHKALRANNKRIRLDVFNKEYVVSPLHENAAFV